MTDLKCTMGCPNLDNMMGGGISCGLITELVGTAACHMSPFISNGLYRQQLPSHPDTYIMGMYR